MIRPETDPAQDPESLDAKLAALMAALVAKDAALDALCKEHEDTLLQRDHFKAAFEEAEAERRRLDDLIQQLKRGQSGPKSERLDPGQYQLALENAEQDRAIATAAREAGAAATGSPVAKRPRRSPAQRVLGHLPAHLDRYEVRVEPASTLCPCCGGTMHPIAEDRTERLDIVPMHLRVRVTVRPRYGCRHCAEAVVQAPAPDAVIPGGLPTQALLAHIAVAKYGDGSPLYRQAQIFARDGIVLDRQLFADWMGRTAWWLKPLWERLLTGILGSPKLFVDDTRLPVLARGRKTTKTGALWGIARDDRPWAGEQPPAVAYVYTEDRVYDRARQILAGYTGTLQVDGWGGFKRLSGQQDATKAEIGPVTLAFCWAHARRELIEIQRSTQSPIATEVLRRIAELYCLEDNIRGQPPDQRRAVRQDKAKPLVEALKTYLEEQLGIVSGKMPIAKAMRYLLNHWDGLCLFLENGRVDLDNNPIERLHRVVATGRRNSLFAGSDAGARSWAIFTSLIQSAKLNGVNPTAYLTDVLDRMVSGAVKAHQLDRLLPWHWKAELDGQAAASP
jgi:transposase